MAQKNGWVIPSKWVNVLFSNVLTGKKTREKRNHSMEDQNEKQIVEPGEDSQFIERHHAWLSTQLNAGKR